MSSIGVGLSANFYVDTLVEPFVTHKNTKALSIGFYQGGDAEFYDYGKVSSKDTSTPNQETVYEIGSVTKTFTTTILAQMVSENKLSLEDRIENFLPENLVNWPEEQSITFLDLATHHSGLPRIPDNLQSSYRKNPANPYQNYLEGDLLDFLRNYKPVPPSERKVSYSNLGMGLLGYLLTKIDDQPDYETMLKKRILEPLEMHGTFVKDELSKLVAGHDDHGKMVSSWEMPVLAGAGAIRSTTQDMLKYLVAEMNSKITPEILFKPRYDYDEKRKIAMGWILQNSDQDDHQIVWHNGGTGGFRSFTGFVRDKDLAVVVLTNSTHSVDEIGFGLINGLCTN